MTTKTTSEFSPEVRARAVRMVLDHEKDHSSRWAAIVSVATTSVPRARGALIQDGCSGREHAQSQALRSSLDLLTLAQMSAMHVPDA